MPVLVCLFISWDIGIYKSRRDVVSAAFVLLGGENFCTSEGPSWHALIPWHRYYIGPKDLLSL